MKNTHFKQCFNEKGVLICQFESLYDFLKAWNYFYEKCQTREPSEMFKKWRIFKLNEYEKLRNTIPEEYTFKHIKQGGKNPLNGPI